MKTVNFFDNLNFKFSAISAEFSFGPKNPKVYHTEIISPSKGVDGLFVNFQKRSLCSQMAIGIVGEYTKKKTQILLNPNKTWSKLLIDLV